MKTLVRLKTMNLMSKKAQLHKNEQLLIVRQNTTFAQTRSLKDKCMKKELILPNLV